MSADWVTAISTAILAVATVVLVIVAISQLSGLRKQLDQSAVQELRRNTVEIVSRVEGDPLLRGAYEAVEAKIVGTTDYTGTTACKSQTNPILNYFEQLAIGIAQCVYEEKMARDYLQEYLKQAVEIWLIGESSTLKAPERMFAQDDFVQLRELYNKWFSKPAPLYRAK